MSKMHSKETIQLYVTTDSFVLVKEQHVLEITFEEHKMIKRGFKCINFKLTQANGLKKNRMNQSM